MKYIIRFFLQKVPRKYLQRVARLGTRVSSLFYLGNKVECTICKKHYRKFLPYGYIQPRENALCPNCLSLERHRLLQLYLEREADFYSAKPYMLHVAPEYCFIKRFEKQLGERYITADLESPLAKVKIDVLNIPFPDNTFDVIFCNHTLEHVEDDIKAMQELHRVLKPTGWGILQSPISYSREVTYEDSSITDPEERAKHFGQHDHLREYGRDYAQRLQKGGFQIEENTFVQTLPPEEQTRYALPLDEIIYIVRK